MRKNSTQGKIGAAIIVWSFLLIVGIGLSAAVQAQYPNNGDQNRRNDRYDRNRNRDGQTPDNYGNYGGSSDLRQTALNAGYNEGLRDGASARQNRRNSDYRNQSTYRKATKDYSSRLGDRELYRRYFREGYENGYNNGLNPGRSDNGSNRDWNRDNNGDRNRNNNGDWNRGNNRGQGRRGNSGDDYPNYGGSFDLRQTALNAGYNQGIKEGRQDRNNRNNPSDFESKSAYQRATSDYSSKLGDRSLYQRYYRLAFENGYNTGLNGN